MNLLVTWSGSELSRTMLTLRNVLTCNALAKPMHCAYIIYVCALIYVQCDIYIYIYMILYVCKTYIHTICIYIYIQYILAVPPCRTLELCYQVSARPSCPSGLPEWSQLPQIMCLKIGHTMAYPPCIDIYSTDQYCNEHDSMRNHRVLEYPIFIEAAMSMQNTHCSCLVERNGPSLAF
jgi:hypothetical protein